MKNHTIDVYFFIMSPPSRATLMVMRALGLKYNLKIVNVMAGEHMSPEFLKINPLHQIPVIDDNGFILNESAAIMKYLVDQYAKDDSLSPRDAKKAALVNQRIFFGACYLFPRFIEFHMPTIAHGIQPSSESRGKVEEALNHLNKFVESSKWIAGDNMTIADFYIIAIVATIDACGAFDLPSYTNLWQWYERSKSAMSGFGYEDINQAGADALGKIYKSKLT